MKSRFRRWAKKLAYFSGVLPARHAIQHRRTLTVVMFHRVLDPSDSRWSEANPSDTVSVTFFADCLRFFRRHYNVVSLEAIAQAVRGECALPPRSLLISFDDGWGDNLHYAAPLLRDAGLPAVIFLAAEAVASDDHIWWQERVFGAYRESAVSTSARLQFELSVETAVDQGAVVDQPGEPGVLRTIARLAAINPVSRNALIELLPSREVGTRMMLAASDLHAVRAAGIELGIHGFSHAPLTMLANPASDLARAREVLTRIAPDACALDALAYPHGRSSTAVNAAAEEIGFKLIFTSVEVINRQSDSGLMPRRTIGRIPIDEQTLGDGLGNLLSEEMATSLFLRPLA